MTFESTESAQSSSSSSIEKQVISKDDQRILLYNFPFLASIKDTKRRRLILKILLADGRPADEVTTSQANNAKKLDAEVRHIAKFIKIGTFPRLIDALGKMKELEAPVDFRNYIDNYEEVIKKGVYQLLFNDKIEYAIKVIEKLGEDINFTEQIRSAYFDWKGFGMNSVADKIKKAFPEIDFRS